MKKKILYGFIIGVGILFSLRMGMALGAYIRGDTGHLAPLGRRVYIPESKTPGPERQSTIEFILNENNSQMLKAYDTIEDQRWADLADNEYSADYVKNYSYKNATVMLSYKKEASSFTGRLEAKGLKPNFVYQIKLMGDYKKDERAFEIIGNLGRWRLPGKATNFNDKDYYLYPEKQKHLIRSYILFDYLLTDKNGNAARDFSLDSTLHVLWLYNQNTTKLKSDCHPVTIDASDSSIYAEPVNVTINEEIWCERERRRYKTADFIPWFPNGNYQARLMLTEESWHSKGDIGGWWSSVMELPVEFTIANSKWMKEKDD
ncbi:MAG: hypothetical protein HRT89_15885 [Lentisphaeria bacterium]|nr:hypothetical protein [Lentisphaeria bacterium]NQZ69539.1 hypothetical protein [Lentisphaeria bacterium]